jgi:hypothetical protein
LIDNALGLASCQRWCGGDNVVPGPRRPRPARRARLAVEPLEDRAVPSVAVLSADGNLWLENPGWQTSGRTWIDGNVQGYQLGSDSNYYVLGRDGNLWQEKPGWQTSGRTWVDGNVQSFQHASDGNDYVLTTDGNLWQELPGWTPANRFRLDSTVQSFAVGSDGWIYALHLDGNLWTYRPGTVATWVDSDVQSFVLGSDSWVYAVDTNFTLWREGPNQYNRTLVDRNVLSVAHGSDGYDYVLGTNGNLWRELPGPSSRTCIDTNVHNFFLGSDGSDYVLNTDGNLWLEPPNVNRTWVDGNVLGAASGNTGYVLTPDLNPAIGEAYSPASGTLFGPNGPSYRDVQQGNVADCWLMASLATAACRVPADITSMFTYAGTAVDNGSVVGVYSVRLYDNSGVARYVTVDAALPAGGSYYARPANNVLWAPLAEKAYVVGNGMGIVSSNHPRTNSYDALNPGGIAEWALQAITGKAPNGGAYNGTDALNAWKAGQLLVFCTGPSPDSSYIMAGHYYAAVGFKYDLNARPEFQLYNPYGADASGWAIGWPNTKVGLFWANIDFLPLNFKYQAVCAGAAPGDGFFNVPRGYNASGYRLLDPSVVLVSGAALDGNQAPYGGGIANVLPTTTTVDSSTITRNEANGGTGGADLGRGDDTDATAALVLTSCLVTLDQADDTSGIGGDLCTFGMFSFDAATVSAGHHASTNDHGIVL